MSKKIQIYCVTAYNKNDLESAQERGKITKYHTHKKPTYILPNGTIAKYKKPALRFKGQKGFYFLYKNDADKKKEELETKYDVVKIRKCKLLMKL